MHRELVDAARSKSVHPGIVPNIGPVAAMTAEFDIVDVRGSADFEHRDEFMLGPVKRPHAAIVLVPDAEVEEAVIDLASCRQELEQMPPRHSAGRRHAMPRPPG